MSMVNLLNRSRLIAWCLALLGFTCEGAPPAFPSTYQADTLLVLTSPAVIEFSTGAGLKSVGSKLILEPLGITWGEMKNSVDWEFGVPGYLKQTGESVKNVSFDLTQNLIVKAPTLRVKLSRVTVLNGDDHLMYVLVSKGSPPPTIISCGVPGQLHK